MFRNVWVPKQEILGSLQLGLYLQSIYQISYSYVGLTVRRNAGTWGVAGGRRGVQVQLSRS